MPQYGTHSKFNIILLIWLTTAIPNILTSSHKNTASQKYDVIDVAKQQHNNGQHGRSRGHTTRIITTGDVDDKFWLKYLGEEFRHAVHLQVDDDNIRPVHKEENHQARTINTNKINDEEPKGIRFVRQIVADKKDIEYIPVDSSSTHQDDNEYSTEEPEIFNGKSTTPTTQTMSQHLHKTTTQHENKLKHKKILPLNKYKKLPSKFPSNPLKAIQAPIIVNLLETKKTEYEINEEGIPIVVQIPPIIYHQKSDAYPEIHHGHITNLPTKQRHTHQYATHLHNTHDTPLQHHKYHPYEFARQRQALPHYSYQSNLLPPMSLPQMKFNSFVKPPLSGGDKTKLI